MSRPEVEQSLADALESDGHIVLWGEPRQGKSALLNRQLPADSYCVIGCAYGQKRYDVYRMLLREAGASVAVERKRRRARGIGAKVSILSGDLKSESETTERAFDIDIANIHDVLGVVQDNGFEKVVVLDDFHYLGRRVQREIVEDLKAIYENSDIRVVLVGVWADRNRLRGVYGDLAGRLDGIEIPRWSDEDLGAVVRKGAGLLGLEFEDGAQAQLVAHAQQSVGLLQDLAYAVCQECGMRPGNPRPAVPVSVDATDRAAARVVDNGIGRLREYVEKFANPKRRATDAQPYKGILHALLLAPPDAVKNGLSATGLLDTVHGLYPFEAADLTHEELVKGLTRLSSQHRALQVSPVLGFDVDAQRLQVVDPLVRLFLTLSSEESLISYLPDQGQDIEADRARFKREVLEYYGTGCAVCPVTHPDVAKAIRLADPPFGEEAAAEYGLPMCANHARAWRWGLLAIEPERTEVVCLDPEALNVTRTDLSHLAVQPLRAALQSDWDRRSSWLRLLTEARARVGKADALATSGRWNEALDAYDDVIDGYGRYAPAALREQVVIALAAKARTLRDAGHAERALDVCDEIAERYRNAPEVAVQAVVARALAVRDEVAATRSRG